MDESSTEIQLQQIESRLALEPNSLELQIERANVLMALERLDEARQIYLQILSKDLLNVAALNNLGVILSRLGHHTAATNLFRALVSVQPHNTKARVNFAHRLRESAELEEARLHYEIALREQPGLPEAHLGLAQVLMYLREEPAAWEHERKAAVVRPAIRFPADTPGGQKRIIVLASPCGGNAPVARLMDKKEFATLTIIPDFYPLSTPLPLHDLIFNTIGDADHCKTSLAAAERIIGETGGPVLNSPARIRLTDRVSNARILGKLEDVVTPLTTTLSRETLSGPNALEALAYHGFTFPLLLRAPGFHGGSHFVRVEEARNLPSAVAALPGSVLLAIEYLNARDADEKIRKYRVMMIDGRLYPLHKAVSQKWMIHYFSADMVNDASHRAEDAAFLEDMSAVLGPRAMRALGHICDKLGLDYAGVDFSVGLNGELLLFEANATMVAPVAPPGNQWDYRRDHINRIYDAVRQMLRLRAKVAPENPQT